MTDSAEKMREAEIGRCYKIGHDGFVGTVIGYYTTREGKEGVVLQQVGTRVVHVYGRKWVKHGNLCNPIILLPKASDFLPLGHIVKHFASAARVLTIKVTALLKGKIVNQSRNASEMTKAFSLFIRRIKSGANCTMHSSTLSAFVVQFQ